MHIRACPSVSREIGAKKMEGERSLQADDAKKASELARAIQTDIHAYAYIPAFRV